MLLSERNSVMEVIDNGGVTSPKGFLAAGIHAGLKKQKKDMAMIVSVADAAAAGTFTTNKVKAAPVLWDMKILKEPRHRAVVVNSGSANACTAERGLKDAGDSAAYAAELLGIKQDEVFVASTGVIGVPLDMDKIRNGISMLVPSLSSDGHSAAEAIITTDTFPKEAAASVSINGKTVTIGGMSKGSGMIHPNMATTLSFITTDAAIAKEDLQSLLGVTVDDTYNMISVDGDTSTNDTVLLLANGLAGNPEIRYGTPEYETFAGALHAINEYLAKKIAGDGEGATALLEARVEGCENREQAKTLAKSIVCSNLTKTAIAGHDATWDIPVHSLIRKMWICSLKARQERYRSLKMERLFPTARQRLQRSSLSRKSL